MPLQLAREVAASTEWEGESLAFRFRPHAYTPALVDAFEHAATGRDLAELIARLVTWLDIVDENGHHIGCDAETLYQLLPVTVMTQLWVAIAEASRPNPTRGATSAAGSPAKA